MSEFTEGEVIFAYRQIGLGRDEVEVVKELLPDNEYPELTATVLMGEVRVWYRKQTPARLMELMGLPMLEVER